MENSKHTLEDVSMEWLDMKKLTVKESTYARYYYTVTTKILPELGRITLDNLNSASVNAFTSRKLSGNEEKNKIPCPV